MALISDFSGFEDGLIHTLAVTGNMDAIITNNIDDFSGLSLPVYRPVDFIDLFQLKIFKEVSFSAQFIDQWFAS